MRIPGNDEHKFFVDLDKGTMEWMYYNPDAISGGQYVVNEFTLHHFMDAILVYPKGPIEKIFEHVEGNCKQYLADIGTPFYRNCSNRFQYEAIASGISIETFEHLNNLLLAADVINMYCINEFGDKADCSDLEKVGIAYTTAMEDHHEIQVYANLKKCQIETYFNDNLIETVEYDSLEDMIYQGLTFLDFDSLVCIPASVLENADLCNGCDQMYDLQHKKENKERDTR